MTDKKSKWLQITFLLQTNLLARCINEISVYKNIFPSTVYLFPANVTKEPKQKKNCFSCLW